MNGRAVRRRCGDRPGSVGAASISEAVTGRGSVHAVTISDATTEPTLDGGTAGAVRRVYVRVGRLRLVVPSILEFCYTAATQGTDLAGWGPAVRWARASGGWLDSVRWCAIVRLSVTIRAGQHLFPFRTQ